MLIIQSQIGKRFVLRTNKKTKSETRNPKFEITDIRFSDFDFRISKSMLYIVIPAFNEEKNIQSVLSGLREAMFNGGNDQDYDIIVVDDASTDNSVKFAENAGATVVRHYLNRGQGAALQTGHEFAKEKGATFVVDFDADGQFNPNDILPAIEAMKKNQCDVILGSRFLDNRSQIPWLKKNIILPISRWINFVFTGIKLSDAHNGFRVFNQFALKNIIITQDGMAHNSEIIKQIKKKNLKYAEFPVEVKYHEFGQGITGGFKIIWDLLIG